ncbi:MAG TPA: alpha/beta hydrolase [Solirubrobacteraceae bacterium]|nr:alpha/beta hydrolase [Solirubrobacteraceae bacterium]
MTESVRPVRVPTEIYNALGYLGTRLLFLNARYAPQVHWGDVALALDGFPTDNLDLSSSAFWDEWRLRWSARADDYLAVADRSTTVAGRTRALRSAAACYHWAEFMYFDDAGLKLQIRQQLRRAFLASLEGADIELSQNELPASADSPAVPYWIVLPPERVRPDGALPAVILSNGLDSMTEVEVLSLAEAYLERGIAAVLFDGPGQGIQAGQTPVLIEMETVVADLVRRLAAEHPRIDTGRLAFGGISFGGYISLRVAGSLGDLFRCVANFGGGPRLADFAGLPRRLKDDFRFAFLMNDTDEIQARFDALAIDPGEPPATQVVSIHGALDDIFPVGALEDLDRVWGPQHRLEVHAREAHVCMNVINVYTQQTADWVAEKLAPKEEQQATRAAALTSFHP